jgi:hypothetical protein
MKFTANVECTPQEARAFFGLPDIAPLQQRLMEDMEARMRETMGTLDPETFLKIWMPAGVQSWQDLQKVFWAQMASGAPAKE